MCGVQKVDLLHTALEDLARGDGRVLPVPLAPLLLSLEESAIEQRLKATLPFSVSRRIDEVLGAGDRSRRAEELDVGHE